MIPETAFPCKFPLPQGGTGQQLGMTLRDYFAAAALTGILACFREYGGASSIKDRVKLAYENADAMLAERERTPTP